MWNLSPHGSFPVYGGYSWPPVVNAQSLDLSSSSNYHMAQKFDGGNFDVFNGSQYDGQNSPFQELLNCCSIYWGMAKGTDHPSAVKFWRVGIRQNCPLSNFALYVKLRTGLKQIVILLPRFPLDILRIVTSFKHYFKHFVFECTNISSAHEVL